MCVSLWLAPMRQGDILLLVRGYLDATLKQARHYMHTHTRLCLRFYSTEDRENEILPPSTSTHTSPAGRGLLINSSSQRFPKPCISVKITVQTDTVVSTFPREEW